jgi:hypothetical protein
MAKRTDVSKLQIGDKFYRVVHYEVTGIEGNNVHTHSDTAGHSSISKGLVENSAYTTHQCVGGLCEKVKRRRKGGGGREGLPS